MPAKYSWKKVILRSLLVLFLLGVGWLVNLIWFKPFSIRLFYDKVFVEFALENPEMVTQLGIPVLYDMSKDELTDASDKKQWEDFNQFKEGLATLKSYDFESQSPANKLNTQILIFGFPCPVNPFISSSTLVIMKRGGVIPFSCLIFKPSST